MAQSRARGTKDLSHHRNKLFQTNRKTELLAYSEFS